MKDALDNHEVDAVYSVEPFTTVMESAGGYHSLGHPYMEVNPGFTIITGLSGAGRSEAARCLEEGVVEEPGELAGADHGRFVDHEGGDHPDHMVPGAAQEQQQPFVHGGALHPSTSTPDVTFSGIRTVPRYHNILTTCPRPQTDGFAPCPPRLARNVRTYRITLSQQVTAAPNRSIEVRSLRGDVDSSGLVDAVDRSVVVGAWTGAGYSASTDIDLSGATNAADRSLVVGAWTGSENCAP